MISPVGSSPVPIAAPTAPPASPARPDEVSPGSPDPFLQQLAALRSAAGPDRNAQVGRIQQALETELRKTVTAAVTGWTTPHVEKPAFPYQISKQRGLWAPQAAAQLAQNRATVVGMLANPAIANVLLMDVEHDLNPAAPPLTHELTDPEFMRFYNALRESSSHPSNFTAYGALVNVGWGSGDHVNATSENIPTGPNGTATHLAAATMTALLAG